MKSTWGPLWRPIDLGGGTAEEVVDATLAPETGDPSTSGEGHGGDGKDRKDKEGGGDGGVGGVGGRPAGSLRRRAMTSFAGLAVQGVLRLAVSVVVGRLAGQAVLGVVAAGMATAQFLILLWPTTSGQAASRFLARARGRGDGIELRAAAGHLARRAVLVTAVLSVPAVFVSLQRGTGPAGASCVAVFLWGVAGQQFTRGVHYGVGAVTRVVVLDVVLSALGLVGVVLALLAGVRDLRLLLPLAFAYLLLTLACWPWGRHPVATRELRREIDTFVVVGSLGTIASAGLLQVSVLVADGLGAVEAGRFAAAANLAVPLTLLSGALGLVLYPNMAEAFGRGDDAAVRARLDRAVRGLVLLVTPVACAVALLAPEIVRLVYGPRFAASGPLLAILVLAVLATMVAVPCVNAMTSGARHGVVVIAAVSLAGLALAVLVWAVAVPRIGVAGVALGYAAGVGSTATFAVVRSWIAWAQAWARPVLALALAVTGVAALPLLDGTPLTSIAGRLAVLVVGVVLWLLVLAPEGRGVLRGLRRR